MVTPIQFLYSLFYVDYGQHLSSVISNAIKYYPALGRRKKNQTENMKINQRKEVFQKDGDLTQFHVQIISGKHQCGLPFQLSLDATLPICSHFTQFTKCSNGPSRNTKFIRKNSEMNIHKVEKQCSHSLFENLRMIKINKYIKF